MFEVRSKTHINRYFATEVARWDIFRIVQYFGFRGEVAKVPRSFQVLRGRSCFTDLTQDLDGLLARMKSNTRNEIRRAAKEGVQFEVVNDIDQFVPFYNAFCRSKGFNDYATKARLAKFRNLLITRAVYGDDVLAMHANVLDDESKASLLMLSCSRRLDKNVNSKLIGWGNRFLHYKDLEYLKNSGYEYYDWSGVCMDPNDSQYTIGQFKLSFGGVLVESITLRSPLFRIVSKLRSLFCARNK